MVDIFDEVEEEERARRWRELARKYLPWVLGAVAILAVAIGGWYGWRAHQRAEVSKASESYAQALTDLREGRTAAAQTALETVSKSGAGGYRSLALQTRAGILLEQGKTQEAVALLDEAAQATKSPLLADAAALKAAFLVIDTAPYADAEKRLTPLTEEDRPFRFTAREALGLAKIMAGRTKEAREDFTVLASSLDAPDGVKQRAAAAIQAIDSGTAARVPSIAKAAAALPAGAAVQNPFNATPGAAAPQAGAAR